VTVVAFVLFVGSIASVAGYVFTQTGKVTFISSNSAGNFFSNIISAFNWRARRLVDNKILEENRGYCILGAISTSKMFFDLIDLRQFLRGTCSVHALLSVWSASASIIFRDVLLLTIIIISD